MTLEKDKPWFFHVGPQKSGRTWLYFCLKEHPEIVSPKSDRTLFFNVNFEKGFEYYSKLFEEDLEGSDKVRFDGTPSYIRSNFALQEISQTFNNKKVGLNLRNPVDRAFSHYWHEKKKGKIGFVFDEVFKNYDLFSSWVEPGLYGAHVEELVRLFGENNLILVNSEQLKTSARLGIVQGLYEFLNINPDFIPSNINSMVNVASNSTVTGDKSEYQEGLSRETYENLMEIFVRDVEKLENLVGKNFENWKQGYDDWIRTWKNRW